MSSIKAVIKWGSYKPDNGWRVYIRIDGGSEIKAWARTKSQAENIVTSTGIKSTNITHTNLPKFSSTD